MTELRADLHIHTYYSDGRQSPADVVNDVKANGVRLFAVTDHDTMLGCSEAEALAGGSARLVRGIEVSAYAGDIKLHTLGYGMDENKFSGFLNDLYEGSLRRTEDILAKLHGAGVGLRIEEVAAERFSARSPIHGMHVARAGAKKGYAPTPYAFYDRYLALGRPAFSCAGRPSPEVTCGAIAAAGGFSVVAHPGRIEMAEEELKGLLIRMKACGLGGIEVYYTTHTILQTAYYQQLAERLSLVPTGGSDTHYRGGKNVIGQPAFYARGELLQRLRIEE